MTAKEFTAEELKEIIRAARIFNPGFSQEQFQSLTEMEQHLRDSGYLETVTGLRKLEAEREVTLSQALETYQRLLPQNEELCQRVVAHDREIAILQGNLRKLQGKHREVVRALQNAETQLGEKRRQWQREEKELSLFKNKKAEEKERINQELAEYRQKADVTEADIAAAEQLKNEVTRHGFNLEQALSIVAEFAGYKDACQMLAEALKKHGKLTSYLSALETEIKKLSENRCQMEGILSRLKEERGQHEAFLSQLKTEIAEKGDLLGFYHRYIHRRALLEYLGASNHLTCHHCVWCGALFWILRPGNIPSISRCPWCGLTSVEADSNAYAAAAQPAGTIIKLLP